MSEYLDYISEVEDAKFLVDELALKMYEHGRADRDKELAEHNVFCSNRPIEDLVLDAIEEERERIVRELEENKRKIQSMRNTCIALSDREVMGIENAVYKRAIEIVRGGE